MKKEKKFGGFKEIAFVNSITALRFFASFMLLPTFKLLGGISAAVFSTIFLLTDWIDGFCAKKLKSSTFFGALFDGASDKMFAIIAFSILMTINPVVFSIPLLIELGIVAVQNKKLQKGLNVQSNMTGKIKTWFLSISIIGSFVAVDLFNMPPFIEYIKCASLDKVIAIRDSFILLGIELPSIITQILTLKSYNKEANEELTESKEETSQPEDETIKTPEEVISLENPAIKLQEIADEKQKLEEEMSNLEKLKTLGSRMFDPEYYAENKDMPIRTLTKDLF